MARCTIRYERDAEQDLDFLGRRVDALVREVASRHLADQPLPPVGLRKALDDNPLGAPYRLRVGEYRAYYEVDEATATVRVIRVGHKVRETVRFRGQLIAMRDWKGGTTMATTTATRGRRPPLPARIARLTPDSPDAEARAMANTPELMALLEESSRRAREVGGSITAEELDALRPLTDEERAEAKAMADQLEREEAEAEAAAHEAPARRPTGHRPTAANGKVLLRLPLSVHRELIERAEAEQTSLNQLVLAYVSRGLGQDSMP